MEKGKRNAADEKIELRSEKVREILGTIPSGLVRWGIAIIVVIFTALAATLFFVKFPYGNGETIFEHLF